MQEAAQIYAMLLMGACVVPVVTHAVSVFSQKDYTFAGAAHYAISVAGVLLAIYLMR